MQLVFEQSTSTVWLFATPNELMRIAAIAQQKVTESRLGDSLTVIEMRASNLDLRFKISANKDLD